MNHHINIGDNRQILRTMSDNSVDSIVTDPPYELGFMGKAWDSTGIAYDAALWGEVLRVLKPGGHLLAFGGSRTYHRLACAIEDAGFEIRDQIMWVYGSGFPKSLDISKAIDKAAGAKREAIGPTVRGAQSESTGRYGAWGEGVTPTAPATDEVKRWDGWGTALKPAHEPIVVARKPLVGTVAANVLGWGVGGLNIDGCRVGVEGGTKGSDFVPNDTPIYNKGFGGRVKIENLDAGRWPANLIHDGSDEVLELFPETKTWAAKQSGEYETNSIFGVGGRNFIEANSGSAARFFYCAKAGKKERNAGLDGLPKQKTDIGDPAPSGGSWERRDGRTSAYTANHHPTVKPIALMRYLVRLVTPPGGTVLDPFTGSGTTGIAAILEGNKFIGIELNPEYAVIADTRIRHWEQTK